MMISHDIVVKQQKYGVYKNESKFSVRGFVACLSFYVYNKSQSRKTGPYSSLRLQTVITNLMLPL